MTLMQTNWSKELNPLLSNPVANGSLLRNVALTTGTNDVSHKLGRKLQGWFITRLRGPAAIYDSQDTNSMQTLMLRLVSDASVVVDLYVF